MEKNKKSLNDKFADYLIDISKLTFGGVVLSITLQISTNKPAVLIIGVVATIIIAVAGFYLYKRKTK